MGSIPQVPATWQWATNELAHPYSAISTQPNRCTPLSLSLSLSVQQHDRRQLMNQCDFDAQ